MARYRVAQVGIGPRGIAHLDGFLRNPDRFDLVALCARHQDRLVDVAQRFGNPAIYTDAEAMLAETRPDVFCFVTKPDVRLSFVELAARYGTRAIAFEKPMATSLREAAAIRELCRQHGIKAIVSQQHKYLTSLATLKRMVDEGDIGEIIEIHSTSQAWLAQLGTHYMDYIFWINGGARACWAVGHIHGRKLLTDSHSSPDYVLGQVAFENGVRAFIECGYLSPIHMAREKFWVDNRLAVYGTHGYAWADTDGHWAGFTRRSRGEMIGGTGEPWTVQQAHIQVPYLRDLADWLDDDDRIHPCHVDISYHGYEILEAICRSALDHTPVELPLPDPATAEDLLERMWRELPDVESSTTPFT
jgi:predicted dehydrogenase